MAQIYARLIDQNKLKYEIVFSANFIKENENGLTSEEVVQFITCKDNRNLTRTDINDFDLNDQLKAQIENLEMKDSG